MVPTATLNAYVVLYEAVITGLHLPTYLNCVVSEGNQATREHANAYNVRSRQVRSGLQTCSSYCFTRSFWTGDHA